MTSSSNLAPVQLSVIIPTYNERENLEPLTAAISNALKLHEWEIIFVDDDSADGTIAAARALNARDNRVRSIRRIGRRGLASACVEGMLASSAPFIAVIDADLQHDPALLPSMLRHLLDDSADIVIASRYLPGGSLGDWTEQRAGRSRFATRLACFLTGVAVTDPMSGYFMLRRDIVEEHARQLSAVGFKILLDILLTAAGDLRILEVPLRFRQRLHGESKMSAAVAWDYLMFLADRLAGGRVPVRFIAFCVIGLTGVGVHFLVLATLLRGLEVSFVLAQAAATSASMVSNFTINNLLTYSDRQLKGWHWFKGLTSFAVICGFGALTNIGVAAWLFEHQVGWQFAALAGIAASAVWNYGVSARYTWGAESVR